MERKLASVQRIREIKPIEGADAIELAVINSWQVVVAKNVGHKVDDLVVYCEIDSFLPIREEFEFLRKSSYKKMGDQEGFRLKTIKLRGEVSQGLIVPIHVLPLLEMVHEGQDVTEMLGIVKFEPPVPAELAGKVKGYFPSFIRKTDEERVQNLTKEYANWAVTSTHQFYAAEKLDGSSATYYVNDGVFGVCSRNLELAEDPESENTFWKVARELDLKAKMISLNRNICLQGELIGEGIQGNPYKLKGQTVRFFNAFDIDKQEKMHIGHLATICYDLKLQTVPIFENFILPTTPEELVKMADGKSMLHKDTDREGLVIRSLDNTISFKAISNKFLLKHEQ
jgi:RNA ligase (TIGR02306 family)